MLNSRFRPRADRCYIAFFKPFGILSQFTQPADSDKRTLAEFSFPADVYPIGRLDWDSEGLLLLSDDTQLNDALLNPRHGHRRTYLVQVENVPTEAARKQLAQGVLIKNERTKPAFAEILAEDPVLPARPVPVRFRKNIPTAWIELTLTEGKNRQVRKMTAAVGFPTLRLVRISIGNLNLLQMGMQPGEWIELEHSQLLAAFE